MPQIRDSDRCILRALAERYVQICKSDRNQGLQEDWRHLNNLESCRPLIYVNDGLLGDEILAALPERRMQDDLLARIERRLNIEIHWRASLGDDRIFQPWITIPAKRYSHPEGVWGIAENKVRDASSRGWRNLPVLTSMGDIQELKATEHRVLDPTPPLAEMCMDIFGDILPVHVSRNTVYGVWGGTDLSQAAGELFGLEELLMALYTEPEMVHAFMAFARDAVLDNLKQGEASGDWSTVDSFYYLTPALCNALPDPIPGQYGASLKDLAWFFHAQEFDGVSPAMFEEFLFNYQLPLIALFGRVTYGCCESLDTKLDILKRIPNLSKIVSGPRSDPASYPASFGKQCVISWRPVTTLIASEHFNESAQRKQIREGLEKLKGCNIEVHLHEPMTVRNELERVRSWVQITREEIERI